VIPSKKTGAKHPKFNERKLTKNNSENATKNHQELRRR
jgi:hypothetical protein